MANAPTFRTGWRAGLTKLALVTLVFETVTGLLITFAPFHAAVEWSVLLHTALGLLTLIPLTWYFVVHWLDYKRFALSDVVLLGYVAVAALLVTSVSGLVVTWQGLFALHMSAVWRNVHLVSTLVALVASVPHVLLVYVRVRQKEELAAPARRVMVQSLLPTVAGVLAILGLALVYAGPRYVNALPEDYQLPYGPDRPFAPSLAVTETGGAYDARSLGGSETCGTAGCHEQIVQEWQPSAHRYAAMEPFFQGVQKVMAEQNSPESTRYCGGCHDPISLFSGSKTVFADDLTGQVGFQEGVSCLVCHGVRKTDLQGNANYVMSQPPGYLFQWADAGAGRTVRDFLIRTYPDQHNTLSKRAFKAPEYCAACHKQFIDEEVNRVGWVQLQNQYDNWKASYWYIEGEPERTIECRECHMPLVEGSRDPAAGDAVDYNRSPNDHRHRSHRFIAANSMVPKILELPGWHEQTELTEKWLQGKLDIPEIAEKWTDGPVIQMALRTPEHAVAGEELPIRLVLTANKVGHDFPTGPLDIIQSWVELHVTDEAGNEVFSSGTRDERHFIAPGSFLFKAEPVDQYGNLIDRHNLWEMVGVRYRRALFPGYSDTVEYLVDCPGSPGGPSEDLQDASKPVQDFRVPAPPASGKLKITAILNYRKIDQYLLNFLLGEDNQLTSPVIEMNRVEKVLDVRPAVRAAKPAAPGSGEQVGAGG
jgi:hypothetical protein